MEGYQIAVFCSSPRLVYDRYWEVVWGEVDNKQNEPKKDWTSFDRFIAQLGAFYMSILDGRRSPPEVFYPITNRDFFHIKATALWITVSLTILLLEIMNLIF